MCCLIINLCRVFYLQILRDGHLERKKWAADGDKLLIFFFESCRVPVGSRWDQNEMKKMRIAPLCVRFLIFQTCLLLPGII